MPFVSLRHFDADPAAVARVPADLARRHRAVPLMFHSARLVVAMEDPMDGDASDTVRFSAGVNIEPVFATARDIAMALGRYYGTDESAALEHLEIVDPSSAQSMDADDAERLSREKPVVRMVENLLREAVEHRASDIHIVPQEHDVDLVLRIEGEIRKICSFSKSLLPAVMSRLKIIGHMDVSERRLPQDGRARITMDSRTIDLRMSVIPTVKGESLVVRVLTPMVSIKGISDLGMTPRDAGMFKSLVERRNGLVLVTGPTGSGKSTTLSAVVQHLRNRKLKIVTVEDPVETQVPDVDQIQVNADIGYTFPVALRHILRHDPDVILIGEIRDRETAEIAIESALTGHMVFSTLHTNSAAATIARMVDMDIEPYLIATTLLGVVAQRLLPRNCPHCLVREAIEPAWAASLAIDPGEEFFRGRGCARCGGSGVSGRVAAHELLAMQPELRRHIRDGVTSAEIQTHALAGGMVPMVDNALALARQRVVPLAAVHHLRHE